MAKPSGFLVALMDSMKAKKPEKQDESEDGVDALEACCDDLIAAVHAKDAKACAKAFLACCDVCMSESGEDE